MRRTVPRRSYDPPARDSARAIANAQLLLTMATDKAFAALTPEMLAHQFMLSVRRAEYLLTIAKQNREAPGGL